MLDGKEGYEFGETMLRRGREEVGVALGVLGEGDEWDGDGDGDEELALDGGDRMNDDLKEHEHQGGEDDAERKEAVDGSASAA